MRRAIGIIRVSETKGREGASFASPTEQRERIAAACERDGLELIATHEELDVSGGTPLSKRAGLRSAVETIEAGGANVLMVAYLDRLVRSLRIQEEVVSRVEEAGGSVVALDIGRVTGETGIQWLQATQLGMLNEYQRRVARERSGAAQAMAVARGVAPWPNVPPGYVVGGDGRYEPGPDAVVVAEAFKMRAGGAPVREVRAFLAENGIERSFHGVQAFLSSRVVLGEIRFGKLVNLEAHEPIVDREVWQAVQRVSVPRGRRPRSERLLARLGVLLCGSCGSRMVVGTANNSGYYIYRCPPTGDCERRMSISAEIAEGVVVEAVKVRLANVEGRASDDQAAREAEATADRAQADLDAAIRAFAGVADEPSALERLAELRQRRDEASDHAARLSGLHSALTVSVRDWDVLTLDERRDLIRAVVKSAEVRLGRGRERVSVALV